MIRRLMAWCVADSAMTPRFRRGGVVPQPRPVWIDQRDFPLIRRAGASTAALVAQGGWCAPVGPDYDDLFRLPHPWDSPDFSPIEDIDWNRLVAPRWTGLELGRREARRRLRVASRLLRTGKP